MKLRIGFIFSLFAFEIKHTRILLYSKGKILDFNCSEYQKIKPDLIEEVRKRFYS